MQWLRQQWFLIALAGVLAAGFGLSASLSELPELFPKRLLVAFVLFLMSWTLDASAMFRALRHPLPASLGVLCNIGLLPLIAWGAVWLFPSDFDNGLLLMAAMPCTLASAAVWTRRAGGNDAVALVVTMVTNFTCFLTVPAWIWLTTGSEVETPSIVLDLVLVAVLPMIAGQLLRLYRPAADWATRHKHALGVVAQVGILSMVLVGTVVSALYLKRPDVPAIPLSAWAGLLALAAGIHVLTLLAGLATARLLRQTPADATAVGIAGSQKTLMIGLQLGTQYAAYFGALAVLPMVAYHVLQLLIDTLVADWLARREHRRKSEEDELDAETLGNV